VEGSEVEEGGQEELVVVTSAMAEDLATAMVVAGAVALA